MPPIVTLPIILSLNATNTMSTGIHARILEASFKGSLTEVSDWKLKSP